MPTSKCPGCGNIQPVQLTQMGDKEVQRIICLCGLYVRDNDKQPWALVSPKARMVMGIA